MIFLASKWALLRALYYVSNCPVSRFIGFLLFDDQASQSIKVENKVLRVRVDVLEDGVHKLELSCVVQNHDPIRQRRILTCGLESGQGLSVMSRLFEQLLLDKLNHHIYKSKPWDTLTSRTILTKGNSVLDTSRHDQVGHLTLGLNKLGGT